MTISPLAGKPAPKEMLIDPVRLEREYFERRPDLDDPNQLVSFGTSGHRGSPLHGSFTEAHILAITQAICDYRKAHGTSGPLYMGKDTHAVSGAAQRTALEVLAGNSVQTIIQQDDGSPRRRSFPAPYSSTIAPVAIGSPTELSLPPRTTRRRMAGSSTTRRTAGPPTPM